MSRSNLGSYFRGPWQGEQREAALRTVDTSALIHVDSSSAGGCQAALVNAPVTFKAMTPN